MTIHLKQSIQIAGIHQPIGTRLTLGIDAEAELFNRGVAVYIGANPAVGGTVPVENPAQLRVMLSALGFELYQPLGMNLTVIGDSRARYNEYYTKNASSASSPGYGGLPIDLVGIDGWGITADQVNPNYSTLYYRAADKSFSFKAVGDTQGPWVAAYAGRMTLPSGTLDVQLYLGVISLTGLPVADVTLADISLTGVMYPGPRQDGFINHMLRKLGQPFTDVKWMGIGSNTTSGLVEQLPYLNSVSNGHGFDAILIGANDISSQTAAATVTANLQIIFDSRRLVGRELILFPEPPRWDSSAAGTPMTAGRLAIWLAINKFIIAYARAHADSCHLVDTFSTTFDPAVPTAAGAAPQPLGGNAVLADTVHFSAKGAQLLGEKAAALLQSVLPSYRNMQGDTSNLYTPYGWMLGTAGSLGGSATGVAPTSWDLSVATGTGAVVGSQPARADGVNGNWFLMACSQTTAGIVQLRGPGMTLAQLGLAIGDSITLEAEMLIAAASGLDYVNVWGLFTGATGTAHVETMMISNNSGGLKGLSNTSGTLRSNQTKIPPGTTGITVYAWISLQAAGAANVHLANVNVRKAA